VTTPRIALLGAFGTVVYLGLAIAARGGVAAFFSEPALSAVAAVTVLAWLAAQFTSGNVSPGEREDRSNRWVLAVFTVIGILGALVPAWSDRRDFWTIDGEAVRWLGVVLYVVGSVLRIVPVFVLGRRFSGLVAIQPGHTLVTGGVYGTVRHPSYLGLIVLTLGWSLAFRSWLGVLLTVLTLVPLVARMNAEETLLRSEFGAEYDAYRARTARLIPGLY
jgi:protein-S-isoprenylcysteine O-methyltransferase Ste14